MLANQAKLDLDLTYVVGVEGERVGCTLRTAPERLAGARDGILRQAVQQLADRVVVLLLELQARPDDALFERERLVRHEVRDDLLDLLLVLGRRVLLCLVLLRLSLALLLMAALVCALLLLLLHGLLGVVLVGAIIVLPLG